MRDKTLNMFDKLPDLYSESGRRAQAFRKALREQIAGTPKGGVVAQQMDRLERVMSALDPQIQDKDGKSFNWRSLMKNPTTVTIYGSGRNGIVGKLSSAMLKAFYARMSELEKLKARTGNQDLTLEDLPGLEGYGPRGQLAADIEALTTTRASRWKDQGVTQWGISRNLRGTKEQPRFGNGKSLGASFMLSRENRMMLGENMRLLLVDPMVDGIESVLGNAVDNLKTIQAATQIQSHMLMGLFDKAVREELDAQRDPSQGKLGPSDFLSRKDYDAIFARLRKYGAIVEPIRDNEHSINLSMRSVSTSPYGFFSALDGTFDGGQMMSRPGDAGVSAAPMLNISRGDATAMIEFYARACPVLSFGQPVVAVVRRLSYPTIKDIR